MTMTAIGGASRHRGHEPKERVRVVIAEDSVLLREGIARLLEESGFEVAGHAGDGEDLLRKVGAHKPDVAVVDVRMPPTHTEEGLRAAHRIRAPTRPCSCSPNTSRKPTHSTCCPNPPERTG
jgi:DNA-binding NarL/FixJ family response regulator